MLHTTLVPIDLESSGEFIFIRYHDFCNMGGERLTLQVEQTIRTLSKEGNSYSVIVKKLKAEGLDVGKATICRVVNGIGKKREAESNGQKFQVDRPRPVRTPATVSKVKRLATTENPPSQRQLSRMCGTSLKTINNIIHKDLELDTRRKGKVHKLTPFHMKNRATNARKLYEEHLAGSRSEYTATLDEAWMYVTYCNGIRKICYIKRGNQVPDNWVHQCSETFPKGFMVVGVMTGRGVLRLIKVPSKVKVNSEFYIECVLKPVIEQLKDLYPGEMDKVFLHHDKASSHTSNKTQQFLQEMKDTLGLNFIRNSDIPVKSPDASPLDFYGFVHVVQAMIIMMMDEKFSIFLSDEEDESLYGIKDQYDTISNNEYYKKFSGSFAHMNNHQQDSVWDSEDPNSKLPSNILTPFILEECEGRRLTESLILDKISTQGQSTVLKLSFELISIIDSLQSFVYLSHLELNNNLIEKITGLDSLINLIHLDLSFNKISVIEGLNNLIKLETLLLFSNGIYEISSLKKLKKLKELSLGMNCISSFNQIHHLSSLNNLNILILAGNPISRISNYKKNIFEILPNLDFLDENALKNVRFDEECLIEKEPEKRSAKIAIPEIKSFLPRELTNLSSYQFFMDPDFEKNTLLDDESEDDMKHYFKSVTNALLILKELDDRCHWTREDMIESFLELMKEIESASKKHMASEVKAYIEDRNEEFLALKENGISRDFINRMENQKDKLNNLEILMQKHEINLGCRVEKERESFKEQIKDLIEDFCGSVRLLFVDLMESENEAVLRKQKTSDEDDKELVEECQRRIDLLVQKKEDLCSCAVSWHLEMTKSLVALARAHEITLDSRRFLKEEKEWLETISAARKVSQSTTKFNLYSTI
ncbi:IKK1 [Cordylochernes scorpioides]|uniref:Dynein axonemal assembly factor 1 homolog n=1 Tax=Cordylochernes scorpioides TaxID=51811 RepID=A0ABY6LLT3_9ARAC|nr:IKK1 [Cordylochernes scorpioides]